MSEKEQTDKSLLKKIEDILHCPICNKPFDFSAHKPIINKRGETQCKDCVLNSLQKEKDNIMISNLLIELIMQEIYTKTQKDNIIYLKPGIKRTISPKTLKKLNIPMIPLTKIDKNCNSKFVSTRDQSGEESITTISIMEEAGLSNDSSFQDEYNNLFINSNDENKNSNIIYNNKRIITKSIYRNTNKFHSENNNNKESRISNFTMKNIDDKDNPNNQNANYSNKVINNTLLNSERKLNKNILIFKTRNLFSNLTKNADIQNNNNMKSTSNLIGKDTKSKFFNNENPQRLINTGEKQTLYNGCHYNYGIKEKIIKFPKNKDDYKAFTERKSSKNLFV